MSSKNTLILNNLAAEGRAKLYPEKIKITVGMATCGRAAGAEEIFETLAQRLEQRDMDVILEETGCIGCCQKEPLVDVRFPGGGRILFSEMNRPRARALVDSLSRDEFPGRLQPWAFVENEGSLQSDHPKLFSRTPALKDIPSLEEIPFFQPQKRIVLRN